MTSTQITLRVINAIGDVTPAAWDACANPTPEAGAKPDYNPFISHDFLSSLELSGSVRNRAGWQRVSWRRVWLKSAAVLWEQK